MLFHFILKMLFVGFYYLLLFNGQNEAQFYYMQFYNYWGVKYSNPVFFDCQVHSFSMIPPCPLKAVYTYFTHVAESSPGNSILRAALFSSCSLFLSLAFSLMPSGTEGRRTVSIHLSHPKTFQPRCKSLQTKRGRTSSTIESRYILTPLASMLSLWEVWVFIKGASTPDWENRHLPPLSLAQGVLVYMELLKCIGRSSHSF